MAEGDLSIGVEEEFQIVDGRTLELTSGFDALMRHATDEIRSHMHPEFYQCVVETTTEPCATVEIAGRQSAILRATASRLAKKAGVELISAGTHPSSAWRRQLVTRDPAGRYKQVEETLQDVGRTLTIFGLHVHIGIAEQADDNRRIGAFNQVRAFLPHILALSLNSPFWLGQDTGFHSYRTAVWAPFPLANVPDPFASGAEYHAFRDLLERGGALRDPRRIWWDVRPHHTLPTLEFRIADMPATHQETLALVAFTQALVKTALDRFDAGEPLPTVATPLINENKWRVARYGLRGTMIDYETGDEAPVLQMLARACDLVSPSADQLGTSAYLNELGARIRARAADGSRGADETNRGGGGYRSGAERQCDVYARERSAKGVARFLVDETMRGVNPKLTLRLEEPSRWRRHRPVQSEPTLAELAAGVSTPATERVLAGV